MNLATATGPSVIFLWFESREPRCVSHRLMLKTKHPDTPNFMLQCGSRSSPFQWPWKRLPFTEKAKLCPAFFMNGKPYELNRQRQTTTVPRTPSNLYMLLQICWYACVCLYHMDKVRNRIADDSRILQDRFFSCCRSKTIWCSNPKYSAARSEMIPSRQCSADVIRKCETSRPARCLVHVV